MVILLDEAEVTQLSIADGYEQRITDHEGTRHTFNPRPGHCIAPDEAWSWTRINGLPSIFEPAERLERR